MRALLTVLICVLRSRFRSAASIEAESIALRHQLSVVLRKALKPRLIIADRAPRSIEHREHTVARHFDQPTAILLDQALGNPIMFVEPLAPRGIPHCRRLRRGIDDVGE
jgi:hypothetical protein